MLLVHLLVAFVAGVAAAVLGYWAGFSLEAVAGCYALATTASLAIGAVAEQWAERRRVRSIATSTRQDTTR